MDDYEAFYREHRCKLFSYLMRMTADYQLAGDIMQESFTRVLSTYAPEERGLALLFRVARNVALDCMRKNRIYGETGLEQDFADPAGGEKRIMVREEYREMLNGLQKLDKEDRDLLALVASTPLSYDEISEIVGIRNANLRVRIHRARTRLKQILDRRE